MKKYQFITILALLLFVSYPYLSQAARTATQSVGGYFAATGDAYSSIYYQSGPVSIGSSASFLAQLYVKALAGSATSTFAVASSSGQTTFSVDASGTTTIQQYQGFGIPTVSTSTGAGTVAATSSLAVGSTDLAGSIYLTTGSNPVGNATILTLNSASSTLPFCISQPMSSTTAQLQNASSTSMATTTTGFALKSGPVGLISTTTYQWNYECN